MEHKRQQIQFLQTASPSGWRWTVIFKDGSTSTGTARMKALAISDAERRIERKLRRKSKT